MRLTAIPAATVQVKEFAEHQSFILRHTPYTSHYTYLQAYYPILQYDRTLQYNTMALIFPLLD